MPSILNRRRFLKKSFVATMGVVGGASGINAVSPWLFREPSGVDTNTSLWMRFQPRHNPPLTKDLRADVVIVGGGYTGLSAAYHVAWRGMGRKVVVLEAGGVGNGASGRNGAMLLPKTASEYMNFESSPAMHKRIYDITVSSMSDLIDLSRASAVKGAVFPVGALQTFEDAEEAEQSRYYAEKAQQLGIPVEYWDSEQTAAAIGTRYYLGPPIDTTA